MAADDEKIKADIVKQLYWDSRVEGSKINITVKEGVVVLGGVASSFLERKAAFEDAWSVPGVLSVENLIQVAAPTGTRLRGDREIKANVEGLLEWNSTLEDSKIEVSVDSSNVVLEGVVDGYWKKLYAEELAATTSGVVDVTNNLAVVPSKQVVDEAIAKDVTEALQRNAAVDADSVGVKVENGLVTLTGTVENWGAKTAAFFAALYTRGVVHVDDRLAVSRL
jgi:osmotically-inducible protein OsmY